MIMFISKHVPIAGAQQKCKSLMTGKINLVLLITACLYIYVSIIYMGSADLLKISLCFCCLCLDAFIKYFPWIHDNSNCLIVQILNLFCLIFQVLGLKAQNPFCRGMPLSPTFCWQRHHRFFIFFIFFLHYRNKWCVLLKLGHQQSYAIIRVPSALTFSSFAILLSVMKVIKNQSFGTNLCFHLKEV